MRHGAHAAGTDCAEADTRGEGTHQVCGVVDVTLCLLSSLMQHVSRDLEWLCLKQMWQ